MVMDSTPAPMPMSMKPALMAAATLATACRPLEHWRFRDAMLTVSGKLSGQKGAEKAGV